MHWLRRAGVAHRLRALIVLVAFAIGSIFARDALLVHQALTSDATVECSSLPEMGASEDPLEGSPRFAEAPAKQLKVRPSGISRRAAIDPFDSPEDDDETDEDSDTVAPTLTHIAILPAVLAQLSAPFIVVSEPRTIMELRPCSHERTVISSRGPPSRRLS